MIVVIALGGAFLHSRAVEAMSLAQMQTLAGTRLLGLRVDALLRRCGLPATIVLAANAPHARRALHWAGATMRLSSADWDLAYGDRSRAAPHEPAWTNPARGRGACLSPLSKLVLHAKGHSGILSVRKRADDRGYVTTYRVPADLYAAHQVVSLSGRWKTGMLVSGLRTRYGEPDEIVKDGSGAQWHRYWVVEKNNKQMPVSLHAVDFEIGDGGKTCARYVVRTSGVEFVQQRLDALLRQWETAYVLD